MRTKREQIIFQAFHDQICRSEFSSGLTLFFGLHGNSSIRYQSAEYSMPAGALLVVNPFELYQVNCSENAEMIAMQIPENLLQLAGWSRQNVCFCYASSQNEKQEYQTIRVLFATIFQDFSKRSNIWETAVKGIQAHPLLGKGPLTYFHIYKQYHGHPTQHAHSIYLDPILSHGIIGVILAGIYFAGNLKEVYLLLKSLFIL